jgi:hypothetical protein
MTTTADRPGSGWGVRLLVALALVLAGAAAAIWSLAHYEPAARLFGIATVAPSPVNMKTEPAPLLAGPQGQLVAPSATASDPRVDELAARLARVESATQLAAGSAGRADALVVAFAARRAIDRGVALGYLENLLVERFGARHSTAVGTIIAASHRPARLNDLIAEYETLGPDLRRGGPQDSWWDNVRRELGSLVEIHRAGDRPSNADAQYRLAAQRLSAGEVDQALAQTMRLPGAARAQAWVDRARRYVAAHRALDEIESAALLGR